MTLIVGKVAAGVVVADVLAGLVAAVALATGMLPPLTPGGAGLALAAMTLLALFGAGLGVAAAAWLRSGEKIGPLGSMVSISLFFLAGGILVLAYLPAWLRTVAYAIPNTYAVHVLRGVLLYQSVTGVREDVLALAAVVGLAVGVPALRRGLEH